MTAIKVCGITRLEDAAKCLDLGVDFIGFIFAPSPRLITTKKAKTISDFIGSRAIKVGVFTQESDEVFKIVKDCSLDLVQLHGDQSEEFAQRIGADRVIRVGRISDQESIKTLITYQAARYYLLDTYKKDMAGGTGKIWDWTMLSGMKVLDKPVLLSGGLNPDNISQAIITTHPFGVDVSSGVESSPGIKDHLLLERLVQNVANSD